MADVVCEIRVVTEFTSAPITMTIAVENAFANEASILEALNVLLFCDLLQALDLIMMVEFLVVVRTFGNQTEDEYDSTRSIECEGRLEEFR